MKNDEILLTMDQQFIKAVKAVQQAYEEKGLNSISYFEIGTIIYENNRGVVKQVIDRTRNIPHLAAIRFAKHFNIDIGYFYDSDQDIKCMIPEKGEQYIISEVSYPLLEQYIEKKIETLESHFENIHDNESISKLKSHWERFTRSAVLVTTGIAYSKAIEFLDLYFDTLYTLVVSDLKTIPNEINTPKHSSISIENKQELYKQQVVSLKEVLTAKDLEISGLKKYMDSLEKLTL